jgi:hypothetical protein
MTKKVLIIGLNYGIEPSIALSGRINIAVNARGVFIAEYGILEENITYLTDEWAPLTKDQILAAIQALVDESTSLEEIYIYYAGYGSGIRIFKQIKYPEVEVPETVLLDPYNPFIFHESPPIDNVVEPADTNVIEILPSDISIVEAHHTDLEQTTDTNVIENPPIEEPPIEEPPIEEPPIEEPPIEEPPIEEPPIEEPPIEEPPIEEPPIEEPPIEEPPIEEPPLTYFYEFAPVYSQYDKLTKQIVGSDYEIIDSNQLLELLGRSHCRTICVLDMCPFDNNSNIMWGTDIIRNVNIISFSESDVYSSGKRAMIHTITSHFYPDV